MLTQAGSCCFVHLCICAFARLCIGICFVGSQSVSQMGIRERVDMEMEMEMEMEVLARDVIWCRDRCVERGREWGKRLATKREIRLVLAGYCW